MADLQQLIEQTVAVQDAAQAARAEVSQYHERGDCTCLQVGR